MIIEPYNLQSISSKFEIIINVAFYIFAPEYTNNKIHNSNNINLTCCL